MQAFLIVPLVLASVVYGHELEVSSLCVAQAFSEWEATMTTLKQSRLAVEQAAERIHKLVEDQAAVLQQLEDFQKTNEMAWRASRTAEAGPLAHDNCFRLGRYFRLEFGWDRVVQALVACWIFW